MSVVSIESICASADKRGKNVEVADSATTVVCPLTRHSIAVERIRVDGHQVPLLVCWNLTCRSHPMYFQAMDTSNTWVR